MTLSPPHSATSTLGLLADLVDPPKIDVFGLLGYEPSTKQAEFHDATEFDVLYGGAAGGGKTKALLMEGLRASCWYPGIRVGAFRRTFDELEESLLKELALVDYASELGARWNAGKHVLTFPNGSSIRFRYLEKVKDATRRQGGEYQLVLLDERTLCPPEAVSILVDERVRTGSSHIPVIGVRSGTNPGGPGHADVRTRFIDDPRTDDPEYPVRVVDGHRSDLFGRTIRFIQAKVEDNPHLMAADPGYVARLDSITDPARRKAMRDGDWDTFAGQVFNEWNRDRHVVAVFGPPPSWNRLMAMDWGFRSPHAVLWAAVDNDGRAWVYRELYGTQVGEHDLARRILSAEGGLTSSGSRRRDPEERVRTRLADPSMFNKVSEVNPLATVFGAEGVVLTPATNDRLAGWQRVHSFLADGPACDLHRDLGWTTCPLLHVMECARNLIRTLPALPYDDIRTEDVDTDAEDHAPDALRYLLMGLNPPRTKREVRAEDDSPQARIRRQLDQRRRSRRGAAPHGA